MFMRALFAPVAALAFASVATATFTPTVVPTSARFGAVPAQNGTGLNGEIWRSNNSTIASSRQLIASAVPEAKFISMSIDYDNIDAWQPLSTFLETDAPSLQTLAGGTINSSTMTKSLLFRFQGYIAIRTPGTVEFSVSSDDGMELKIGDKVITSFDGDRGFGTSTGSASFAQAGLYAVDFIYWANSLGSSGVKLKSSVNGGPVVKADLYAIPAPAAGPLLGALGLFAARRRRA